MSTYNPSSTLYDARAHYFAVNDFGDGGYNDKWVKVEYGSLRFYFPNTKERAYVVKYHDIHHILTEYETTLEGEAEIGAWEVATGCTSSLAAWLLNLAGFAAGLFINPRGVYKAFLRGRQSSNLYHMRFGDELLSQRVGQLRQQLSLDKTGEPPVFIDNIAFVVWAIVSVITLLGMIGIVLLPLIVLSALAWMLFE